ncbi:response regulator transcription factor [Flavobacterium ovatum]|uniref:response regulator transcription factor n=1 Tax=Flavobacterium ovatum TaxID=1928857 RepID=UPI00344EBDD1
MKNSKKNIVLIEDDYALGESIVDLLILSNFNVKWFKNGYEAFVYLESVLPDLIISDLLMPVMGGEALFLKIRNNNNFSTIPFVIITASKDDETKFRQLENGVNDYIMKPFKTRELILKINNILNLKSQIEKKNRPDPFSKVTIKLSEKDFLLSVNIILAKNIKGEIDIQELSNRLHISKSTLDKKIRKRTNKNISQYIREFKLDYALKLISLGERNVQFLVDQSGFNSLSYFSTSFKKYVGLTPRDYIKTI